MFGASSELASVMEFGFYLTPATARDLADVPAGDARLHVLASVLEVQVSHGALLGRRLVQRLVAHVVHQLRLMVPERNADVVRVAERQMSAVYHHHRSPTVNFNTTREEK